MNRDNEKDALTWTQLLREARDLGLTPDEVRSIFAIIKENNANYNRDNIRKGDE